MILCLIHDERRKYGDIYEGCMYCSSKFMFDDALSLLLFYADHKGALYTCIYDYIQFYVYLCNVHSMFSS